MKQMKKRGLQWALIGASLSFLGPLGEWVFLKLFAKATTDSLLLTYFYTEVVTLISFGIFGYLLGLHAEKIEFLALRDKLTGLYNRHYLIEHLEHLLAQHRRHKKRSSVMMFDLDNFKKVNDYYGHMIGDMALKAVAECVQRICRDSDTLTRYGGEEFIVVCHDTDIIEGSQLAERIRESVEYLTIESLGFPGPQTISIGVHELSPGDELTVDKALYCAKKDGRNKVFITDKKKAA